MPAHWLISFVLQLGDFSDDDDYIFEISNFGKSNNFATYEGSKKNGVPWGHGLLVYKNGETYDGQFKNGSRNGFGKLTFAANDEDNRSHYEGYFFKDLKNGNGTMLW